ncbi:MAG TPA: ABC transporter ATP-binding protein [Halanaerobiales bacterium]|nr:ABC transporter ATP-binding protein [Halanaerobiales bacterium]HPZ62855.1 ABC transporter ATP-binding protein [Halanaerobiales bacterium]HQD04244.1 ABC transporter ATP-binding protein [Halanaerobiales bacterium]
MKQYKKLLSFIKPYRTFLILATISMLLATAMGLAGPWIIRSFMATITSGGDIGRIYQLALFAIIVYVLLALAQYGQNYLSHHAAWMALKDIRQYIYDHIQSLSLKFFQDKQTGELMSRVINDTRDFEILIAHAIPTIIVNACMLAGVFIILLAMNISLTLYTLIPIPFLLFLVMKFNKLSRPLFKKNQEEVANVNSILQDHFSGIKEIKAFTREEKASKMTLERITRQTIAILRALKISNAYFPSIQFFSNIGTVIVILFGGKMALEARMPMEDVVAFILYLNMFYQPIISLGQISEGIQQALASGERVVELLNVESDIVEVENPIELEDFSGEIEFKNVDFHYVENIPVLSDISFKIKKGEMAALVGPTGVGKTTIAHLIPRFYDPSAGAILINGVNIKDIKLHSLRKHISIVSQDVFLFNGTVKENILFGRPEASEEEVIEAAKAANAHQFIMELEKGYETQVGERGVKLSGGQKQRISIARAILKNAPILILDEATSAVDTKTEMQIQEALKNLMKDKTSIVIAHRLSTIQEADQIIILKDGRIVESGKHEELINANGLYASLCQNQMGGILVNM